MNRRGFLALLGAALAEPLVPKGTAFSFLGGIYRPEWVETPTLWPIPKISLYDKQSLKTFAGTDPKDAEDTHESFVACSPTPDVPGMVLEGISVPGPAKLFRNRSGDWMILRDPKDVNVAGKRFDGLTVNGSVTILANTVSYSFPEMLHFDGATIQCPGRPLPELVVG